MRQSFKKALYGIAIFALFTVAIGFILKTYDATAADVTYKVIRGVSKKLKDMGDGTHAPTMHMAGEEKPEAVVLHYDVGVTADTYYILIDLDDTTNYPHASTTGLIIRHAFASGVQTGDIYRMMVGVVSNIDGSGATINPMWEVILPSTLNVVNRDTHFQGGGIDLEVSGTTAVYLKTPDLTIAAVTTLTDLSSPAGTVNAEIGDLFLWVDELSGAATLTYWSMGMLYDSK